MKRFPEGRKKFPSETKGMIQEIFSWLGNVGSCQAVEAHAFNPSHLGGKDTWISVSSKAACSIEQVPGQPRRHWETLSVNTKTRTKRNAGIGVCLCA